MGWRCVRSTMCRLVMPCDRRRQGRGEKNQRRRKDKQTLSLTVCPDVPGKWPTPSEPTWHPAHVSVGRPHLARWGPVSKYYQSGDEGEQTHKHALKQACEQTNWCVFVFFQTRFFLFSFSKCNSKCKKQKKKPKNNGGPFTLLHLWRWASAAPSRRNWWVDCCTINSFYITTEG